MLTLIVAIYAVVGITLVIGICRAAAMGADSDRI
jgi:hypothetical protein